MLPINPKEYDHINSASDTLGSRVEIKILSELHSQQIALLGYIQIEETKWFIEQKHRNLNALIPPGSVGLMIVCNHQNTLYYRMTTDQNQAQPVK